MKKLDMFKQGTGLIVSVGVGAIVAGFVDVGASRLPMGGFKKACAAVATIVLAGMVSEAAGQYSDKKIDSYVKTFNDASVEASKKA